MKKIVVCLSALLMLAIIACAAMNDFITTDTVVLKKPVVDITDSMNSNYEWRLKKYGKNKTLPIGYEKQIVYALSYFPELIDTKIDFIIEKSEGGIIATRPTIMSVFKRSSKRTYIVIINDSIAGRTLPMFKNSNVNGQVGILGHELCHIVWFNNQSGLGLIGLGIAHISRSYIDRWENRTDSMDIVRGLGYQLLDWKKYLDTKFHAMRSDGELPDDKPAKRERYMSVGRIKEVMARSGRYE